VPFQSQITSLHIGQVTAMLPSVNFSLPVTSLRQLGHIIFLVVTFIYNSLMRAVQAANSLLHYIITIKLPTTTTALQSAVLSLFHLFLTIVYFRLIINNCRLIINM
jgi:hypothetical protein